MNFDLTPELVDQIIFGMENQETEFFFDTQTFDLIPSGEMGEDHADPEDPDRYVPLPPWHSVHGFNLMERFVLSLRNPLYREMLRDILASGRGVFRQFKDALKQREDIEKLWYRFKEREMKKEVYEWYNSLRESWGLEEIDLDFEETDDLVLTDFIVEKWDKPDNELVLMHDREGFYEMFPTDGIPEETKFGLYHSRRFNTQPRDEGSLVYRVMTPAGDLAGFLWAVKNIYRTDLTTLHVLQIYVLHAFRGLGLANALLQKFCEEIIGMQCTRVTIELMGKAIGMNTAFHKRGFMPFSEVLELDLRDWEKINSSFGQSVQQC